MLDVMHSMDSYAKNDVGAYKKQTIFDILLHVCVKQLYITNTLQVQELIVKLYEQQYQED